VFLTGKIRELEFIYNNIDEKTKTLQLFMSISGIGSVHANKFYNLGFRNITDLRNNQHHLNSKQKIGIKYHEDLSKRIPREECERIFKKINECLFKVFPSEELETLLLGSYIRGKSSSSDLDILIMRRDNESIDGILDGLILEMNKKGYIKEVLSVGKSFYDNYYFMSICKFEAESPHRRLDLNVNLRKYRAFAVMHYTGSQYFNKTIRLVARRLGYTLNDVGMSRVVRVHNQKVLYTDNIECNTEEEIFKQLDLEYKTPIERDI
jgi:DNA polymerase lambda